MNRSTGMGWPPMTVRPTSLCLANPGQRSVLAWPFVRGARRLRRIARGWLYWRASASCPLSRFVACWFNEPGRLGTFLRTFAIWQLLIW